MDLASVSPKARLLAAAVALALAATAGGVWWYVRDTGRTLTAHFERTVGIYPDSDLRILGVKVGKVVTVEPQGRTVKVTMRYSRSYPVPAGANAVIVPPSLVADRYIQLVPAYRGGARLPDHAELPASRTVEPLELDEVMYQLSELVSTLGPDAGNSTGALARLLKVGRANAEGNGELLGRTLNDLATAAETFADGRGDLYGTIDNLHAFTAALAANDKQVRRFNAQLAGVAEALAAERAHLASALRHLASALAVVSKFVRDNREELVHDINALTDISAVLVRQRQILIDFFDIGPTAASNYYLATNPKSGTIDTRVDVMGQYDPATWVCSLLVHALSWDRIPKECFKLAEMLHRSGAPLTPELAKLRGLALPLPGSAGGPAPRPDAPPPSGETDSSDPTFGGILG
ncbi:MAG: MCE family protein [Micromonosporaceae bacterium]